SAWPSPATPTCPAKPTSPRTSPQAPEPPRTSQLTPKEIPMTELSELRLRAVMPAPPEAVHAALTDAAALRVWLAEHAEVALPDRYEFWGRYTPDGAEPHQRVLHASERTLRLARAVEGARPRSS